MKKKFKQLKKETEKLLEEMGARKVINRERDWVIEGVNNNFFLSVRCDNELFNIFGIFYKKPYDDWMNSKMNFHKSDLDIEDIKSYLKRIQTILKNY